MTILVLDADSLQKRCPNVNDAFPVRVRVIMQTLDFDESRNILTVKGIQNASFLQLSLAGLEPYDPECVSSGTIIDSTGFYDGNTVQCVDIACVNGAELTTDKMAVLNSMAQLG